MNYLLNYPLWLEEILFFEFWGNTGEDYLNFLVVFLASFLIFGLVKKLLILNVEKIAQKTETNLDDFLIKAVKNINPPFYFVVALYIALQFLTLNKFAENIIQAFFVIVITVQAVLILQKVMDFFVEKKISESTKKEKERNTVMLLIKQILNVAIWVVAGLMIVSNLGVNINSLIAGLGIGGIAVALASQKILGDLFSSFSIFLDKPFRVGDFISLGTESGTVKKIGIKSTRIKTLKGDELVVSNNDLTSSRVRNLSRMNKRRVSFSIGVVYKTSAEKLEKIPEIIKNVIEKTERAEISRVHFKSFGEFSLIYDIVYVIETPEYEVFMDVQQKINFEIYREFEKEKIEFAYPTQTIQLNRS